MPPKSKKRKHAVAVVKESDVLARERELEEKSAELREMITSVVTFTDLDRKIERFATCCGEDQDSALDYLDDVAAVFKSASGADSFDSRSKRNLIRGHIQDMCHRLLKLSSDPDLGNNRLLKKLGNREKNLDDYLEDNYFSECD